MVGKETMIAKMTSKRRRPDGNGSHVEMLGFSMVFIGKKDKGHPTQALELSKDMNDVKLQF